MMEMREFINFVEFQEKSSLLTSFLMWHVPLKEVSEPEARYLPPSSVNKEQLVPAAILESCTN